MPQDRATVKRLSKWYFGGVASCGAACFTHPLDTLKVSMDVLLKLSRFTQCIFIK